MTVHDNVATYRRWFEEGCNRGNVELADRLYSPHYVTHSLGSDCPPTLEGLKTFIRALRQGMPALRTTVEDTVAEGARVAGRLTLEGAHTGTLLHIPATGKRAHVGLMVIARFDQAGKWVEDWATWDQLGLLQQLGVTPMPASA